MASLSAKQPDLCAHGPDLRRPCGRAASLPPVQVSAHQTAEGAGLRRRGPAHRPRPPRQPLPPHLRRCGGGRPLREAAESRPPRHQPAAAPRPAACWTRCGHQDPRTCWAFCVRVREEFVAEGERGEGMVRHGGKETIDYRPGSDVQSVCPLSIRSALLSRPWPQTVGDCTLAVCGKNGRFPTGGSITALMWLSPVLRSTTSGDVLAARKPLAKRCGCCVRAAG